MADYLFAPFIRVLASALTYTGLLAASSQSNDSRSSIRARIKFVSAFHSILATWLTLISLSQDWDIRSHPDESLSKSTLGPSGLDDSENPLIAGTNDLANYVTALEAGYLIYDTGAVYLESRVPRGSSGRLARLWTLLRRSPITVIHHVALASALLYLQTYIAKQREKGVKIIMAFFLMNASTPLLHYRWWMRKVRGRRDVSLDAALAILFAVTRFGSVYWAIAKYGQYHGLDPWSALRRQRTVCQIGTGLLAGVNAAWWLGLVSQMARGKTK